MLRRNITEGNKERTNMKTENGHLKNSNKNIIDFIVQFYKNSYSSKILNHKTTQNEATQKNCQKSVNVRSNCFKRNERQ